MNTLTIWKAWMERWNDPDVTLQERKGLLHDGFGLQLEREEFKERLLFYIREATGGRFVCRRGDPEFVALSVLAHKAYSALFLHLKNMNVKAFDHDELAAVVAFFCEPQELGDMNWQAPSNSGDREEWIVANVFLHICDVVMSARLPLNNSNFFFYETLERKLILTLFKMWPSKFYELCKERFKDKVDPDLILRILKDFGGPGIAVALAHITHVGFVEWVLCGKSREAFDALSARHVRSGHLGHEDCLKLLLLNLNGGAFVAGALTQTVE